MEPALPYAAGIPLPGPCGCGRTFEGAWPVGRALPGAWRDWELPVDERKNRAPAANPIKRMLGIDTSPVIWESAPLLRCDWKPASCCFHGRIVFGYRRR